MYMSFCQNFRDWLYLQWQLTVQPLMTIYWTDISVAMYMLVSTNTRKQQIHNAIILCILMKLTDQNVVSVKLVSPICKIYYIWFSNKWHATRHSMNNTVYPKKYAHGFVVLCFVVVMQSFIMNSHEVFIHNHQGCFAGTGAIVRLPQCQWSKPDGYGKISQCITTTKHSKAKTVCIFLGIYCSCEPHRNYHTALLIYSNCACLSGHWVATLVFALITPHITSKDEWRKPKEKRFPTLSIFVIQIPFKFKACMDFFIDFQFGCVLQMLFWKLI